MASGHTHLGLLSVGAVPPETRCPSEPPGQASVSHQGHPRGWTSSAIQRAGASGWGSLTWGPSMVSHIHPGLNKDWFVGCVWNGFPILRREGAQLLAGTTGAPLFLASWPLQLGLPSPRTLCPQPLGSPGRGTRPGLDSCRPGFTWDVLTSPLSMWEKWAETLSPLPTGRGRHGSVALRVLRLRPRHGGGQEVVGSTQGGAYPGGLHEFLGPFCFTYASYRVHLITKAKRVRMFIKSRSHPLTVRRRQQVPQQGLSRSSHAGAG